MNKQAEYVILMTGGFVTSTDMCEGPSGDFAKAYRFTDYHKAVGIARFKHGAYVYLADRFEQERMEHALERVKGLDSLQQYTAAECVEFVRITMSLTSEQADELARKFKDSRIDRAEAALNPWS